VPDLGLVVVDDSCVLVHDHKVNLEQTGRQLKLSLPPLLTTRGIAQGGTPAARQAGRQEAATAAEGQEGGNGTRGSGASWSVRE